MGPLVELPLRPPIDPLYPAQHSNEVSIAAFGTRVVATYRNIHKLSADTWDSDAAPGGGRQVAVAVSEDRGETYALAEPDVADSYFSDPLVRVTPSGKFWLVRLRVGGSYPCAVHTSTDGVNWIAGEDIPCDDKPWLAVDDSFAWIASHAGMIQIPADGAAPTMTSTIPGNPVGGYADGTAAHMLGLGDRDQTFFGFRVVEWDALTDPRVEIDNIPGGPDADSLFTIMSTSLGATSDGRTYLVRSTFVDGRPNAVLFVHEPTGEREVPISAPGAAAFHTAGALDDQGRLHVMWYETSGTTGVLKYARSTSATLDGFEPPIIVDANVVPGDGWFPMLRDDSNERLREYVDLTVDGGRVYLAWTRAVEPPSRVFTTWLEHL